VGAAKSSAPLQAWAPPGRRSAGRAGGRTAADRRRTWLRHPAPPLRAWTIRGWPADKALVVAVLSAGLGRAARRHGVATNAGFLGYTAFRDDASFGT
ncbi:hypothetical protein J8J27_25780, partial [Mycobacterium tuberculosis]|nr:hypothetical protein [Mycobacterium tuberculosis]